MIFYSHLTTTTNLFSTFFILITQSHIFLTGQSMAHSLHMYLKDIILASHESRDGFLQMRESRSVDNPAFSNLKRLGSGHHSPQVDKTSRSVKRVSWPELPSDTRPSMRIRSWSHRDSESRWMTSKSSTSASVSSNKLLGCPPRLPIRRDSFHEEKMD